MSNDASRTNPALENSDTPDTSEHRVDLPAGRTLAVSETGDPGGPAVLLLHPAPGSRLLDPDPAVTAAAGIRLIGVDRAGYGATTALPDGAVPTITGYADDAAAALAALGVDDVAVVGWSAGGRVALALAAGRPDLVRAAVVVATPAPHEDVPWIPEEHIALIEQLQGDPGSATAALTQVFAEMAAAPPAAAVEMAGAGPADEAALAADPTRRARLEAMLAEAFAQGAVGMAADIVSYTVVPWGFDPTAVEAPTTAFYGEGDVMVSPAHGEWYASRMVGAELRVVPDSGHLVALTAWADILAAVV
jgi:pimeloyl-ACP methyl ester carboxylesterase